MLLSMIPLGEFLLSFVMGLLHFVDYSSADVFVAGAGEGGLICSSLVKYVVQNHPMPKI